MGDKPWTDQQIERLKKVQRRNLIQAADTTQEFGVIVGRLGITEEWREQLSAYRELARELGLILGQFHFNDHTYIALAPIRRVAERR